jgi:hypothetical protein
MTVMRSTPGRIAAVAIGIPVLLAGIGEGALSVTGALARTSENHSASYPWHGGTLTVKSSDGDLTVRRSSSASTVQVTYTEHFGLRKPTVTGKATATGVDLSAKCPGSFYSSYCSVDYTLLVPDGVPLRIEAGDGSISGVELRSTEVNVTSGDGSISLQWAVAPKQVGISSGDGSVNLAVPVGSGPYAIDEKSGDGTRNITVKQDPTAPRTMRLRTGDGNIAIH